jgi:hypothetical protein
MLAALDRSTASLHCAFDRANLEVLIGLLHAVLPITLRIRRDADDVEPDAHFHRAAPLGA